MDIPLQKASMASHVIVNRKTVRRKKMEKF